MGKNGEYDCYQNYCFFILFSTTALLINIHIISLSSLIVQYLFTFIAGPAVEAQDSLESGPTWMARTPSSALWRSSIGAFPLPSTVTLIPVHRFPCLWPEIISQYSPAGKQVFNRWFKSVLRSLFHAANARLPRQIEIWLFPLVHHLDCGACPTIFLKSIMLVIWRQRCSQIHRLSQVPSGWINGESKLPRSSCGGPMFVSVCLLKRNELMMRTFPYGWAKAQAVAILYSFDVW